MPSANTRFSDERSFVDQIARAPYTIVHIASHGSFESNASESFILTDDGRLTLDDFPGWEHEFDE